MYIFNNNKQKYSFYGLKLLVEVFGHCEFKQMHQDLIDKPKVLS